MIKVRITWKQGDTHEYNNCLYQSGNKLYLKNGGYINLKDMVKVEKQVKDLSVEEYIHIMNSECLDLTHNVDDKLLLKMGNLTSMSYKDLEDYIDITDLILKKGVQNEQGNRGIVK